MKYPIIVKSENGISKRIQLNTQILSKEMKVNHIQLLLKLIPMLETSKEKCAPL